MKLNLPLVVGENFDERVAQTGHFHLCRYLTAIASICFHKFKIDHSPDDHRRVDVRAYGAQQLSELLRSAHRICNELLPQFYIVMLLHNTLALRRMLHASAWWHLAEFDGLLDVVELIDNGEQGIASIAATAKQKHNLSESVIFIMLCSK